MTTTIVNDRDVLLQASQRDVDPTANKYLNLSVNTPVFHADVDGNPFPAAITLTAKPINISGGTVSFSISSGGTLTGTGNSRTLAFTDMQVDAVTVTATITDLGQTYTASQIITKVEDGKVGHDGPPGAQYATAYLYKWSTTQPDLPIGTSTLSWNVGANTSYIGTDGWYTEPPINPAVASIQLWVASKSISAPSGTPTTDVTYTVGAKVYSIAANAAPGVEVATVRAYKWGIGPAPTATGTATYTWASATYNTPPSGWTATKTDAPALGYTLFEATVNLVDSTGATTTAVDWTEAAIVGISYIGVNGPQGNSLALAYTLVDGSSLNSTPDTATTSGHNLPATGTWGETRAWQSTPPVQGAGQSVFQSNGVYNPLSDQTVWGVPYLSAFRVGNLSAIATNTGTLTVSGTVSSANGNFTVDSTGNVVMKSITIKDSAGNTILSSGTALNPAYAAAGTLNSDVSIGSDGTLSGAGGGKVTIGGLGYTGDLNATNGATIGVNLNGQITGSNVATFIAGGAITNTQIGGDLQSTNWNGSTGTSGTGWYLERVGNFYANNVKLRGSVMGGAFTAYAWPASGTGFYLGPEGLLLGNGNTTKYFQVDASGNVTAPGFSIVNGAATFSGTLSAPTMTGGTITGSTITGNTIKTAASGTRIEMTSSGLAVYGDAGAGLEVLATINNNNFTFGSISSNANTNGINGRTYNGFAVNGFAQGPTGTGVQGVGFFIGVWGRSSGSGTGVNGQAQGTGIAVKADGSASNFCFYAASGGGGSYGPFTGSHDGLVDKGLEFDVGDIVVDVEIVKRHDVSNTIAKIALSSKSQQKNVVGVFVGKKLLDKDHVPAALVDCDVESLAAIYDSVMFNAIGEGMINVCGENGDIEAGDYITTSSTPGKGMRQSDDLLHNYTVAKARESVTFSSSKEVKMVACTYHCG